MRLTYDPEVNAAYIYLRDPIGDGESKRQTVCDDSAIAGDIVLDFDTEGVLLGIEVLGARRLLPKELLDSVTPDR